MNNLNRPVKNKLFSSWMISGRIDAGGPSR